MLTSPTKQQASDRSHNLFHAKKRALPQMVLSSQARRTTTTCKQNEAGVEQRPSERTEPRNSNGHPGGTQATGRCGAGTGEWRQHSRLRVCGEGCLRAWSSLEPLARPEEVPCLSRLARVMPPWSAEDHQAPEQQGHTLNRAPGGGEGERKGGRPHPPTTRLSYQPLPAPTTHKPQI